MVFKGISSHQYIFQKFCFTWNADDDRFVELLIKAGADVNHRDMHGGSVMHWAAHKASDKIANTLIKSGVEDVSVQDHTGKTPLYYAKSTGNSMVYLSWKKSIWTLFFSFLFNSYRKFKIRKSCLRLSCIWKCCNAVKRWATATCHWS